MSFNHISHCLDRENKQKKKKTKFKDFHSIDLKIENIKERKLIPHIKKNWVQTGYKTDLEGRDYFGYKSYIGDSIPYLDLQPRSQGKALGTRLLDLILLPVN